MRKPFAQAARGTSEDIAVSHHTLNSPARAARALVRTLRVEPRVLDQPAVFGSQHCTDRPKCQQITSSGLPLGRLNAERRNRIEMVRGRTPTGLTATAARGELKWSQATGIGADSVSFVAT